MSLKEEIESKVCEYGRTITSSKVLTDEVVSIFEKRIDILQQAVKPHKQGIYTHKEMNDVESNIFTYIKEMLK